MITFGSAAPARGQCKWKLALGPDYAAWFREAAHENVHSLR